MFPAEVVNACVLTVGYMYMHRTVYPFTEDICLMVIHDYSDPSGIERYEEAFDIFASRKYDINVSKKVFKDDPRDPVDHPLLNLVDKQDPKYIPRHPTCGIYKNEILRTGQVREHTHGDACYKRKLMHFPHIRSLIQWDIPKESKMYLASLPDSINIETFKENARNYLRRNKVEKLHVPDRTACLTLNDHWYSDGGLEKRRNCEEPVHSWDGPMIYETFWTTPTSKREVWVPPLNYKINNVWWQILVGPILEKDESLVSNETNEQIGMSIKKRMRPCRKIDLKGSGIQFPRSVIIALMEVIYEFYPNEDIECHLKETKRLFNDLSVKMPDGKYNFPTRGVGLGYYETLKTLVMRIILHDVYIVKMFNDDILVANDDYEKARLRIQTNGFVINEKKTGEYYRYVPYFLQCSILLGKAMMHQNSNGRLAALVFSKYHYIRKNIFLTYHSNRKTWMMFAYRQLFGWEVYPDECIRHPTDWGLNPTAEYRVGWVKGGLLRKFTQSRVADLTEYRVKQSAFPFMRWKDRKFSLARSKARRLKNVVSYTGYDEYLHPIVEDAPWIIDREPGAAITPHLTSMWYDLRCIIQKGYTTGRYLRGLTPEQARFALARFSFSRDPIGSYIKGGARMISPFHKDRSLTGFSALIYDSLEKVDYDAIPYVNFTDSNAPIEINYSDNTNLLDNQELRERIFGIPEELKINEIVSTNESILWERMALADEPTIMSVEEVPYTYRGHSVDLEMIECEEPF